MREIKFRGKSLLNNNWVYGNLIQSGSESFIVNGVIECNSEHIALENWMPIESESAGQFTGMKDMNGNKIYEGDIVKRMGITGVVTWECEYTALGFYLKSDERLYDVISPYTSWSLEVIGNIYENPDSTSVLWRDIRRTE